jgi:hypothetical protein
MSSSVLRFSNVPWLLWVLGGSKTATMLYAPQFTAKLLAAPTQFFAMSKHAERETKLKPNIIFLIKHSHLVHPLGSVKRVFVKEC